MANIPEDKLAACHSIIHGFSAAAAAAVTEGLGWALAGQFAAAA